jgi:PncC family amidohydrolase
VAEPANLAANLATRLNAARNEATPHEAIAALQGAVLTVAVAESLTGGLLCGSLTEVPGASSVVSGGVITYSTQSKHDVLGVSMETLNQHGAVSEQTAREMAIAVQHMFSSRVGIATTGVAGPDRQEQKDVGTVFIGIAVDNQSHVVQLNGVGDREQIRAQTVARALALLAQL